MIFPSKSFLIGEYLALAGGPSIVITHKPEFTQAKDPYNGAGGFGFSTAEFLFKHYTNQSLDEILKLYLGNPMHGDRTPSGFDLVAQVYGKPCVIRKSEKLEVSEFKIAQAPLMLFQASHLPNRKTKTYEHLRQVSIDEKWATHARVLIEDFIKTFESKEWHQAGALMNQFSESLRLENWVAPEVQKERLEFLKLPGVLGVKGAGAMQTDAMWVMTDPTRPESNETVMQIALKLQLRPLSL
ncbi:MAG: hypothetical protein KA715_03595 [Xanthomonadaceae bacterium]|nr:hypothetical protein [Xanthomonadaceae bacterium]